MYDGMYGEMISEFVCNILGNFNFDGELVLKVRSGSKWFEGEAQISFGRRGLLNYVSMA